MSKNDSARVWTGLGVVYVFWGSTYLAIRLMVDTIPPLFGSSLRFLLAGCLLHVWVQLRHRTTPIATRGRPLASAALLGVLLIVGGPGLTAVAEQDVPSGLAALIVASVPLWVVVLRRILGERITKLTLAGVLLGLGGVALLVLPTGSAAASATGIILLIVVSVSFATGSVLAPRLPTPADPLTTTTLELLLGGVLCAVGAVALGELDGFQLDHVTARSWAGLLYLVGPGTLLAFTTYVWLLEHAPSSKVATYAYVNPIVAVFLGWLILSEEVTIRILAGATIIVGSVALVITANHRATSNLK